MTDTHTPSADDTIAEKTDRLETIIAQLEDGDVSLEQAHQLYAEGQSLLADLEDELAIGDGEIIEQS